MPRGRPNTLRLGPPRPCAGCGAVLPGVGAMGDGLRPRIYCTQRCRDRVLWANRLSRVHQRQRNCARCDAPFEYSSRTPARLFCDPCRPLAAMEGDIRRGREKRWMTFHCPICNTTKRVAYVSQGRRKYCSKQCTAVAAAIGRSCPVAYTSCPNCGDLAVNGRKHCRKGWLHTSRTGKTYRRTDRPRFRFQDSSPCRYCGDPVSPANHQVCEPCKEVKHSHHIGHLLVPGMPRGYVEAVRTYRQFTKAIQEIRS